MTYGRPLMIPCTTSEHCIPPSAIDDEFLSQNPATPASQPEGVLSLTECYVESTKLQNILGHVLSTLYYGFGHKQNGKFDLSFNFMSTPTATDRLKNGELQMLLNIDKSLSAWSLNLPAHLKVQNYGSEALEDSNLFGPRTSTFKRQAIVLRARLVLNVS